jgi:signal transduction histidine kinase
MTQPIVGGRAAGVIGAASRPHATQVASDRDLRRMMRPAASTSVRRMRRLLDPVLALALLGAGLAEIWVPFDTSLGHGSRGAATVTCAVATVALAFRRRAPVLVAALVSLPTPIVCAFTPVPLLFFGGLLPLLLATYTLGATRHPRALAIPAAAMVALQIEIPAFHKAGEIVFDWICLPAAAAVGWAVGRRERQVEETESRAAGLERTAVAEERARIARELHDVIAHSVSVIVVQAGAAEQLVEEEPEHVREALRSIRATGSEALAEMRRMLGILRAAGDELELAPQPSISELAPLLDRVRAAGLAVELAVEGTQRPLPAGLDLAAYRILQEALTNTRKHAKAERVVVRVRYLASSVQVEVSDDGRGPVNGHWGGHGLIGMRERVALYGGELSVGAGPEGGFRVAATLPVG